MCQCFQLLLFHCPRSEILNFLSNQKRCQAYCTTCRTKYLVLFYSLIQHKLKYLSDLIDLFCKSRDQRKVKDIVFGWWPIMQILHNITFNGFYLNSISVRFVLVYCLDLQPTRFRRAFCVIWEENFFPFTYRNLKLHFFHSN